MPKGYKIPKSSSPRATMRAGSAPKSDLLDKSSSGIPSIPAIRPTYKRNKPANPSGFKPGKY